MREPSCGSRALFEPSTIDFLILKSAAESHSILSTEVVRHAACVSHCHRSYRLGLIAYRAGPRLRRGPQIIFSTGVCKQRVRQHYKQYEMGRV